MYEARFSADLMVARTLDAYAALAARALLPEGTRREAA